MRTRSGSTSALAAAALCALAALAQAGGKIVDLGPRFARGGETVYDHSNTIVYTNQLFSQRRIVGTDTMRIALTQRIRYRVKSAGPEGATLAVTFDRVGMHLTLPDGRVAIDYDSGREPKSNVESMYTAALERIERFSVTVRVDRTGSVLEIEGMPDFEALADAQAVRNNLRAFFGPVWLALVTEEAFGISGGVAARAAGDVWTELQATRIGGGKKLPFRHELTFIGEDTAVIEGRAVVASDADGAAFGAPDTEIESQSVTFECEWDLERGLTRRFESAQLVKLRNQVTSSVQTSEIEATILLERVDENAPAP